MVKSVSWQNESTVDQVVKVLSSGGVIASATDTICGLLAPITKMGYDKLNEIKQRFDKPFLILIGDRQKLSLFCQMPSNPKIQKIMDRYWPGPLTIILPAQKDLPEFIKSKENTVAVRVPDHAGLHKVLSHFDGLFSTSANLAGDAVPSTVDHIQSSIQEQISLLVKDEHPKDECIASTIIDCTGDDIRVIRQGSVKLPA